MIPNNLSKAVKIIVQKLGFDIILALKELVKIFTIPAENDDSGVNLALLVLLKQANSSHFLFWKSFNYNIQEYYQRVLKYAYRPFDGNYSQNKFADQIDPRIYYLYHDFLARKKNQAMAKNETPSVILPTTWLLNYEQQINGQIRMPFSNNNVDSTVCANVLFGISSFALNSELNLQNIPELQKMIGDIADLLVYVIQQKISLRPDLALVYYPSKYDFFWFVSRIISLYKRKTYLPPPFDIIYKKLVGVMKGKGTQFLLKNSIKTNQGHTYWVQFLGNFADKNRNEDAIFSTSLALNALLDTWTVKKGKSIAYDSDLPENVRVILNSGIDYLNQNLKPRMKQYNSFFSGSWKSDETDPYIYPANVHFDKNSMFFLQNSDKNVDPNNATMRDITTGMNYVMKGFIQSSQYEKMLQKKWFGQDVPTQLKGFNQGPFPYWSAQPITQVIALSVLSKFMRSEQNFLSLKN